MTIVYSAECKAVQQPNRSTGMLPILVILFVVSYTILAMLVVEQGRTIESQRSLLRDLLKDSSQLAILKGQLAHAGNTGSQPKTQTGKPSARGDQQKGSVNTPGSSGKEGKEKTRAGKPAGSMKEAPRQPDADKEDVRRLTRII